VYFGCIKRPTPPEKVKKPKVHRRVEHRQRTKDKDVKAAKAAKTGKYGNENNSRAHGGKNVDEHMVHDKNHNKWSRGKHPELAHAHKKKKHFAVHPANPTKKINESMDPGASWEIEGYGLVGAGGAGFGGANTERKLGPRATGDRSDHSNWGL
jgi:hypothetical protein